MSVCMKRREPQDAAVAVLKKYGGLIRMELPQFSAKWLKYYRPLWLVQKMVRYSPLARVLERIGFLPRRFYKVAHFDADAIVLTVYGYPDVLRQAAREISSAMGVEIKVVAYRENQPERSLAA